MTWTNWIGSHVGIFHGQEEKKNTSWNCYVGIELIAWHEYMNSEMKCLDICCKINLRQTQTIWCFGSFCGWLVNTQCHCVLLSYRGIASCLLVPVSYADFVRGWEKSDMLWNMASIDEGKKSLWILSIDGKWNVTIWVS
jgi:hypothetical protein